MNYRNYDNQINMQSFNRELKRQFFHLLFGFIILAMLYFIKKNVVLTFLLILFLFSIILSLCLLKTKKTNLPFLGLLSRDHELRTFPLKGFVFFIVGCILTIKLFSQNIAFASIIVLTFGDSISTIINFFGKKYSLKPFSKFKSMYGTICGVVVSFIVSIFFVEIIYALTASIFGMLAEALSIKLGETEADDNLIVPLAAGASCYLLQFILSSL